MMVFLPGKEPSTAAMEDSGETSVMLYHADRVKLGIFLLLESQRKLRHLVIFENIKLAYFSIKFHTF